MRVLVTAASRHGTTAEIARIIAGVLRTSDIAVVKAVRAPHGDCRPWDDIAEWAIEIVRYLRGESIATASAG